MNVNRTGFRTLDALGRDLRVELIEVEVDGRERSIWLYLRSGWWLGPVEGTTMIHESTVAQVLAQSRLIVRDERPEGAR